MRVELAEAVAAVVAEHWPWYSNARYSNARGGTSFAEIWHAIEIPPKRAEADYSITLAFSLSATAKKQGMDPVQCAPQAIANTIGESLEKRIPQIQFSLSDRGHINCVASTQWYRGFVSGISQYSGAINAPVPHAAQHEHLRMHSVASLEQELCAQHAEFLNECGLSLEEPRQHSDRRLLLLAANANVEQDSEAYRLGLHGSENTPWVLSRFLETSTQMLQEFTADEHIEASESEFEQALGVAPEFVQHPLYACWREAVFCQSAVWWLSRVRSAFFSVEEKAHRQYFAEVFSHILYGVRLFSTYYNHPNNRVSPSLAVCKASAGLRTWIAYGLEELTRE